MSRTDLTTSWWRHQMETFFALLAICAGNAPVTGEFPSQRPVAWINGWVNNREAGDLRRYRAHYDVIVMWQSSREVAPAGTSERYAPFRVCPAYIVWYADQQQWISKLGSIIFQLHYAWWKSNILSLSNPRNIYTFYINYEIYLFPSGHVCEKVVSRMAASALDSWQPIRPFLTSRAKYVLCKRHHEQRMLWKQNIKISNLCCQ